MADTSLAGRRVLAIVTNYGVEQDELVVPVGQLRESGAEVHVAAVSPDEIRTLVGDKDPGETVRPDLTLADVDPTSYDLLLIPGGTLNADTLRLQDEALEIVRSFTRGRRPIAAICHGPWVLVEAGVVESRTLTSYASLRTDIRNAGGTWVDEPVISDNAADWVLVTSRTPDDLGPFVREAKAALTAGTH
ncbi:type 1 glutamine amidotransferase [Streptomyces sp. NBC_01218]|uniref:type 1 glutamine amidotransferase domain-containing protein n=1 Tax=Streptomyces sp. NBC_01218 TaxID=2903780 RepID=UPI002E0D46A4|nr:type 1 glutamine amidotransferase [Streptomyces sp. NBC_01218]